MSGFLMTRNIVIGCHKYTKWSNVSEHVAENDFPLRGELQR